MTVEERLARLEKEVFGEDSKKEQEATSLVEWKESVNGFMVEASKDLVGDHYLLHSIYDGKNSTTSIQITTLEDVLNEENDEELSSLCSLLSSKVRIRILRLLSKGEYTSGEMAEVLGMQPGHMHHHLKELCNQEFVEKAEHRKYTLTDEGFDLFFALGALNRRMMFDKRR